MSAKPTELAITLATLPGRYADSQGWMPADSVAFNLRALGFDCTAQQAASWLARMARADAPWVEMRKDRSDMWEYRVTRFGRTDIQNKVPTLDPRLPWLPTMRIPGRPA